MSRTMGREGGWNVEEGEFVEQANDDVDVRTPLITDPCHPRKGDGVPRIPTLVA